eukprot:COSAG05_NODE_46_length_25233_cov_40.235741_16_plen_191_part_00
MHRSKLPVSLPTDGNRWENKNGYTDAVPVEYRYRYRKRHRSASRILVHVYRSFSRRATGAFSRCNASGSSNANQATAHERQPKSKQPKSNGPKSDNPRSDSLKQTARQQAARAFARCSAGAFSRCYAPGSPNTELPQATVRERQPAIKPPPTTGQSDNPGRRRANAPVELATRLHLRGQWEHVLGAERCA